MNVGSLILVLLKPNIYLSGQKLGFLNWYSLDLQKFVAICNICYKMGVLYLILSIFNDSTNKVVPLGLLAYALTPTFLILLTYSLLYIYCKLAVNIFHCN